MQLILLLLNHAWQTILNHVIFLVLVCIYILISVIIICIRGRHWQSCSWVKILLSWQIIEVESLFLNLLDQRVGGFYIGREFRLTK